VPWPATSALFRAAAAAVILLTLLEGLAETAFARSNVLAQQVYVWQRAWTEPVREAVAGARTNFGGVVVLQAEVQWAQDQAKAPKIVRVPVNFATLRQLTVPVGFALRVGPGPVEAADQTGRWLAALGRSLVQEARSNGITPAELQIDFDCPESKLAGYSEWITPLRGEIAPVPIVLTVLPAWLKQPAFRALAAAADGYVLQVHSLERPQSVNAPFTLCDPVKTGGWVRQASQLGLPFRVALPTYSYLLAFSHEGQFIGLSAEGSSWRWPEGTLQREVGANAAELAQLIAEWTAQPPAFCTGVIWYRLPVAGENLNWPWATLSMVMSGRSPVAWLRLEARRTGTLVEVDWVNAGTGVCTGAKEVRVRWERATLLAGDGLHGFALSVTPPHIARLTNGQARLRPGERQQIGWLRFDQKTEVELELE